MDVTRERKPRTTFPTSTYEAGQESPFRRLGMDRNRNNALSKNWGGRLRLERHVLVRVRVTVRVTVRARGGLVGGGSGTSGWVPADVTSQRINKTKS